MTIQTAQPGHRFSTKTAGVALAGAVLAVGAGYGVANVVLDDAPAIQTPADDVRDPVDSDGFAGRPGLQRQ